MLRALVLITCLFSSSWSRLALSQPPMDFRAALEQYEANISGLLSYAVKIRKFQSSSYKLTVGDEVYDVVTLAEYEAICDVARDSLLMTSNRYVLDASYVPTKVNSSVYLRSAGSAFRLSGDKLVALQDPKTPLEGFFDPRAIGLGFCFELGGFVKAESVFENIKQWKNNYKREIRSENEVVFVTTGEQIVVDPEKECAMTQVKVEPFRARNTFIEKDGLILPHRCAYHCGSGDKVAFVCDWIFVNKPIPPDRFDVETVSRLMGL